MKNPNTINWMELAASTGVTPQTESNFRDVVRFIAGLDGLTRCQAAATLVFSLWQVAGTAWTAPPPSLLLVHDGPDPLDDLARKSSGLRPEDPVAGKHYTNPAHPSLNHMRRLAGWRDATMLTSPVAMRVFHATHDPEWIKAKATNFGSGRSGRYCRRWDKYLGLVTDEHGDIILRLEKPDDVARFRDDLLNHPERLTAPSGRGEQMQQELKTAMVSGALTPAQWDHTLADAVVNSGLPFHIVPHTAEKLRRVPPHLAINASSFSAKWKPHRAAPGGLSQLRPITCAFAPPIAAIEERLRERLRHLPACYEFLILRTFRELPYACAEISRFMHDGDPEEAGALARDLICLTSLSLLIGISSLSFHGIGLVSGCDPKVLARLLAFVRSKTSTSKRAIQRKLQKMGAAQLSAALTRLAAEGLVVVDGTKVSAVTWDDFLAALWLNTSGLLPELATSKLVKKWGPPRAS